MKRLLLSVITRCFILYRQQWVLVSCKCQTAKCSQRVRREGSLTLFRVLGTAVKAILGYISSVLALSSDDLRLYHCLMQ